MKVPAVAGIVLGVLVALNEYLAWGSLQYLWAVLLVILGIWGLTKE
tara:strand:+ start:584 stop:721 length:138 start_codon:yes stop_codon:yes gene_type:complete